MSKKLSSRAKGWSPRRGRLGVTAGQDEKPSPWARPSPSAAGRPESLSLPGIALPLGCQVSPQRVADDDRLGLASPLREFVQPVL